VAIVILCPCWKLLLSILKGKDQCRTVGLIHRQKEQALLKITTSTLKIKYTGYSVHLCSRTMESLPLNPFFGFILSKKEILNVFLGLHSFYPFMPIYALLI